jgi:hypothetical protein
VEDTGLVVGCVLDRSEDSLDEELDEDEDKDEDEDDDAPVDDEVGDDEEVVELLLLLLVVLKLSGRSDCLNASWIIGAKKFMDVTNSFGMVVNPGLTVLPLWHENVSIEVFVTCDMHVCPFRFQHVNPVGQHPTNVSSGSIWN